MAEQEEKKTEEQTEEIKFECPNNTEGCTEEKLCKLCTMGLFVREVAKLTFGRYPHNGEMISESMILSELDILIRKGKDAVRENVELKTSIGKKNVEIDQAKAQAVQAKTKRGTENELVIKASQALAQLQAAYGDDTTWDNIGERATGAVMRLQQQAALMKAAEIEMTRMRERLAQLEPPKGGAVSSAPPWQPGMPGIPDIPKIDPGVEAMPSIEMPPVPPPAFSNADLEQKALGSRLEVLENDLRLFRLIGRIGSRLLGLDSLSLRR